MPPQTPYGILGPYQQPNPAQGGLLGRYTPTIADLLQGIGVGLLSQRGGREPISAWNGVGEGLQYANQLGQQRAVGQRQDAQMGMEQARFGMDQQQFAQQQKDAQDAAAAKAQEDAQFEASIAGLAPDQQAIARANRGAYGQHQVDAAFPKPFEIKHTTRQNGRTTESGYYDENNVWHNEASGPMDAPRQPTEHEIWTPIKDASGKVIGLQNQWGDQKAAAGGQGESLRYGLNPVYGTNDKGETVLLLPDTGGGISEAQLPPGVKVAPQTQFLNTGTGYVPVDKRNPAGAAGPTVGIDVTGKEVQKGLGDATATAATSLAQATASADQALALINQLKTDPARKWATGASSIIASRIPGTAGYNYTVKVNQLKGKTFLEAYNNLRGGGAITEVEGTKAENAIARLDTAQTEDEFVDALDVLADVVKTGKVRLAKKAQGDFSLDQPVAPATAAPQATPGKIYNFDANGDPIP